CDDRYRHLGHTGSLLFFTGAGAPPHTCPACPACPSCPRAAQQRTLYYGAEVMTRDELLDLFRASGALLEGHFRLTSGLHSSGYLQCALVLQHPGPAEALGAAIAARSVDRRATVVLSP